MSIFIFFVQLEPDVDHLAPIAYRLNKELPGSVTIVCVNPLHDIHSDHRLKFLQTQGVNSIYLSQIGSWDHLKFRLSLWLTKMPKFLIRLVPEKIWPKIYWKASSISSRGLELFFRRRGTQVVTIDEALPSYQMIPVLEAAKNSGAKTVRVITGNPVLVTAAGADPKEKGILIDYQIRPHWLAPVGPTCLEPTKEFALGCMRYCEEWEIINSRLLESRLNSSPQLPKSSDGKLNVLIFERSTKGFRKDHPLVKKIQSLDFCNVLFRARPRIIQPRKLYEDSIDSIPSAQLIQWADVVICSVSSIALEVLYQKKLLLYPKFIAPNETTTYERLGACWKLDTEEELIAALEKIQASVGKLRPYPEEKVTDFFTQSVYLGRPKSDVLGEYSRFYQSILAP